MSIFSSGDQALMHPQGRPRAQGGHPRWLLLTWFLGPWHSGRPGKGEGGIGEGEHHPPASSAGGVLGSLQPGSSEAASWPAVLCACSAGQRGGEAGV